MSTRLQYVFSMAFLVALFVGYFFNIKFNALGFGTFYPAIFLIIIIGIFGGVVDGGLRSKLLVSMSPLCLAIVFSIISFLVNSPDSDYFFVGAIFLMAAVGLSSFGFFAIFPRRSGQILIISVIAALSLNAILMISMFVFPKIQLGYLNLLSESGFEVFGGIDSALDSMYRFRMIGFSGFAAYASGFMQSIGLFFLAVYYRIAEKKIDLRFLFISVLLIISALLSARSSLIGISLWIVFCLVFFGIRFFVFISLISIFIFASLFFLIALMDEDGAKFFVDWLLEFFLGEYESKSLSENISMLDTPFLDAGFYGFSRWFGEFGYDYFRAADVGFIRLILAGGFGSLSLILLHYFLMGLLLIKENGSNFFRILYVFLMLYFSIVMFKGAILFDFFAFDFLMLMLCWVSQNRGNVSSK